MYLSEIDQNFRMRFQLLAGFVLLASAVSAQQPQAYFQGAILHAESAPCANNNSASLTSARLNSEKSQAAICPDYVLATDRVIYHIQPRTADQAPNLHPGDRTQLRVQNQSLIVRADSSDGEYEFVVISLMPRTETSAKTPDRRLNHLQ